MRQAGSINQALKFMGVTLLEVMLMLLVTGLVIFMSIRYYGYAIAHQQADAVIGEIQSITAAADNLSQGTDSYAGSVSTSSIEPVVPVHGMTTPWGGDIKITGATDSSYTVTIYLMPAQICHLIKARLSSNAQFNVTATTCPATGVVDFTYTFSHIINN